MKKNTTILTERSTQKKRRKSLTARKDPSSEGVSPSHLVLMINYSEEK